MLKNSMKNPVSSVHPHARGEHDCIRTIRPITRGSSPRPWGTFSRSFCSRVSYRFIPTPVGNMMTPPMIAVRVTVHPHARGEHGVLVNQFFTHDGSSPRPWGTYQMGLTGAAVNRFIPTPVGNISSLPMASLELSVHPHARGEHFFLTDGLVGVVGSSPRPWGTFTELNQLAFGQRFIPTPVGNIVFPAIRRESGAVHPHARGEHICDIRNAESGNGSSPRPWGTCANVLPNHRLQRFIPTPVGNIGIDVRQDVAQPVHPHARGEHVGRAVTV